ncbi:hypothetical protein [Burkholderia sp. Tr-20355]|uniref:hypothetical protein n=1 Tax=Burkholderia sp. Tr-20355 TaxID=2703895 RepID=UPI00198227DD|nr:hypothetical protein [Burkholderia sp. Tr-20355]
MPALFVRYRTIGQTRYFADICSFLLIIPSLPAAIECPQLILESSCLHGRSVAPLQASSRRPDKPGHPRPRRCAARFDEAATGSGCVWAGPGKPVAGLDIRHTISPAAAGTTRITRYRVTINTASQYLTASRSKFRYAAGVFQNLNANSKASPSKN